MRKNFGSKPWTYPQPVFIVATFNEDGTANAMTAAWGCICKDDQIFITINARHKTAKNIQNTGAFTVSMGDVDHLVECDYVGLFSANDVADKLEKVGFHSVKSEFVNAPLITEFPMTLECSLVSYDLDTGYLIGKIVNVSADEVILDADGEIDSEKLASITFDPVQFVYRKVGEIVGKAFSDGNKLS